MQAPRISDPGDDSPKVDPFVSGLGKLFKKPWWSRTGSCKGSSCRTSHHMMDVAENGVLGTHFIGQYSLSDMAAPSIGVQRLI